MMQVVADGWWCRQCEFFEDDDQINTEVEVCIQCGCNGAEHLPVEVVTKGLV
jgi:hypothetical protein